MSDCFNEKNKRIYDRNDEDVHIARNDVREMLISTELSPKKAFHCKIEEVRSPEIRKCRLLLQPSALSQSSVKPRKKLKTRYSEPKKLPINISRVDKSLQVVQAKRQLTEFYIGNEEDQREIATLKVTEPNHNRIAELQPLANNDDATTSSIEDTPILNSTTKNYLEITKMSLENTYRSTLIQNVDSPRKQMEPNLPLLTYQLLTKSNCEVDTAGLIQSELQVSSKFLKQTATDQSEAFQSDDTEIFSSPEIIKIRRKRKYQPGSLLDRYHTISSKVEKDKALFSYEIDSGLRMTTGQFVTCDLAVISLSMHRGFQVLHCKSTSKICESNSNSNKILNFDIIVISRNLPHKFHIHSVINLHFPLTIMLDVQLNALVIFAKNRIVLQQTPVSMEIDYDTNTSKECTYNHCKLFSSQTFELDRIIRVIHSNTISCCVHECLLTQLLVFEVNLEVILLHLYKDRSEIWMALTCDKENQYCLIEFNSDNQLIRLEGSKIKITGIRIVDFITIDRFVYLLYNTVAELINFVHNNQNNVATIMYKAQVLKEQHNIICIRNSLWPKMCSNISYILAEDKEFKRYRVKVECIRTCCRGLCINDGTLDQGILLNCTESFMFTELKVPFFIDAIFYLKGELFTDTYSKILNI